MFVPIHTLRCVSQPSGGLETAPQEPWALRALRSVSKCDLSLAGIKAPRRNAEFRAGKGKCLPSFHCLYPCHAESPTTLQHLAQPLGTCSYSCSPIQRLVSQWTTLMSIFQNLKPENHQPTHSSARLGYNASPLLQAQACLKKVTSKPPSSSWVIPSGDKVRVREALPSPGHPHASHCQQCLHAMLPQLTHIFPYLFNYCSTGPKIH